MLQPVYYNTNVTNGVYVNQKETSLNDLCSEVRACILSKIKDGYNQGKVFFPAEEILRITNGR
jgi:hypothetical protein